MTDEGGLSSLFAKTCPGILASRPPVSRIPFFSLSAVFLQRKIFWFVIINLFNRILSREARWGRWMLNSCGYEKPVSPRSLLA